MKVKIKSKIILFLYTELSGYMLNCLAFANKNGYQIYVVKYSLNDEAPFDFDLGENINFIERDSFQKTSDLTSFINKIKPKLIFVSGWVDNLYLSSIKKITLQAKVILMIDTPWLGVLKQKIWRYYFYFHHKKFFHAIWVPGDLQKIYAKKLGFTKRSIYKGLYTCDDNFFKLNKLIDHDKKSKKILLYVGRYVHQKGIIELWKNFLELNKEVDVKCELWCVGTGELWQNRISDTNIKHFGFIQPKDLPKIVSKSHVYILPSKYEPWGVSLHEMVSLGKPVLVSENIGSSSYFVKENINGFIFSHSKPNDFKNKMKRMMELSLNEINKMGRESVHLSNKITTKTWLKTLNEIYD